MCALTLSRLARDGGLCVSFAFSVAQPLPRDRIYLFFNRNLVTTLQKICCHPFTRFRPAVAKPNLHEFNSSMHSEAYAFGAERRPSNQDSGRLGTGSGSRPVGSPFQLSPSVCKQMQPCIPISIAIATNSLEVSSSSSDEVTNSTQTRAQVNDEPPVSGELVVVEVNETNETST